MGTRMGAGVAVGVDGWGMERRGGGRTTEKSAEIGRGEGVE